MNYSDDYYAETDEFWYVSGDYSLSLLRRLHLGLHVGYNMLEEDGGFLSSDEDQYTDYSVTVLTPGRCRSLRGLRGHRPGR